MAQAITDTQRNDLERRFGAAYQFDRLIKFDHQSIRSRQILPHGEDFVDTCIECKMDEERKRVLERREELVQNELVGETVWVRSRGYKTMKKATVKIKTRQKFGEPDDTEYVMVLQWEDEPRPSKIDRIPRLDVVIEGERLNVWDDGVEDLKPWERDNMSTSARPCEKSYESDINVSMLK